MYTALHTENNIGNTTHVIAWYAIFKSWLIFEIFIFSTVRVSQLFQIVSTLWVMILTPPPADPVSFYANGTEKPLHVCSWKRGDREGDEACYRHITQFKSILFFTTNTSTSTPREYSIFLQTELFCSRFYLCFHLLVINRKTIWNCNFLTSPCYVINLF